MSLLKSVNMFMTDLKSTFRCQKARKKITQNDRKKETKKEIKRERKNKERKKERKEEVNNE